MALNENTPLERIQLDVSPAAKLNLKLFATLSGSGVSMSTALDKILTEHITEIARIEFGDVRLAGEVFSKAGTA